MLTLIPDAATMRAEIARASADDPRWTGDEAVEVVDTTGSTNTDLLEFARVASASGHPLPSRKLRVARAQTGGRGRMARPWQTPHDASLAMSIGMNTPLPLSRLAGLTLVCGLAVHAALRDFDVDTRLKWPNDVIDARRGAKLAGILVETAQANSAGTWVVIGVGINLRAGAALAGALGRAVTDLAALGARGLDPNLLVARIVAQFETRLTEFERTGFAPFRDAFDRVHAYHRRAVRLSGDGVAAVHGVFEGVGPQGEVLLRRPEGSLERLIAGELSLAAQEG